MDIRHGYLTYLTPPNCIDYAGRINPKALWSAQSKLPLNCKEALAVLLCFSAVPYVYYPNRPNISRFKYEYHDYHP